MVSPRAARALLFLVFSAALARGAFTPPPPVPGRSANSLHPPTPARARAEGPPARRGRPRRGWRRLGERAGRATRRVGAYANQPGGHVLSWAPGCTGLAGCLVGGVARSGRI